MPKVTNTRKQRAKKLLERVKRGPSFESPFGERDPSTVYRLWASSWVVDELEDLIPELRKERNARYKSI